MNIYVGNLPYSASEDDLREAFEQFGTVTSVNIIIDKITGRPRGFGFVEMEHNDEGTQAIEEMNGKEWKGRTLTVNEARPRDERPRGGGGGGARFNDRGGERSGGGGGGGNRGGGGGYSYSESGGGNRGRDRGRDRDRDRDWDRGSGRGRGDWNRGERDGWDSGDEY